MCRRVRYDFDVEFLVFCFSGGMLLVKSIDSRRELTVAMSRVCPLITLSVFSYRRDVEIARIRYFVNTYWYIQEIMQRCPTADDAYDRRPVGDSNWSV